MMFMAVARMSCRMLVNISVNDLFNDVHEEETTAKYKLAQAEAASWHVIIRLRRFDVF
jgi:hypothetical protein